MNTYANYKATIRGDADPLRPRAQARGQPMPIVLSHGWPWTYWDYEKVIRPLSRSGRVRRRPAATPSTWSCLLCPATGFSSPLTVPGINYWRTADIWVELMQKVLGYERILRAQGGDWGAFVTNQLGHKYADRMIAIYRDDGRADGYERAEKFPQGTEDYAPERARVAGNAGACSAPRKAAMPTCRWTKPQTLSYGIARLARWAMRVDSGEAAHLERLRRRGGKVASAGTTC